MKIAKPVVEALSKFRPKYSVPVSPRPDGQKRGGQPKGDIPKSMEARDIEVQEPEKGGLSQRKDRANSKADAPLLRVIEALVAGNHEDAQTALAKELKIIRGLVKKNPDDAYIAQQRCDASLSRHLPRLDQKMLESMDHSLDQLEMDASDDVVVPRMRFLVKTQLLLLMTASLEKRGIEFQMEKHGVAFEGGDKNPLKDLEEGVFIKLTDLSYVLSDLADKSQSVKDELASKNLPLKKLHAICEMAFEARCTFSKIEQRAVAVLRDAPLDIGGMPLTDVKGLKEAVDLLLLLQSVPKEGLPDKTALRSLRQNIEKTEEAVMLKLIGPPENFDASKLRMAAVAELMGKMSDLPYIPNALEKYKKEIDLEHAKRTLKDMHADVISKASLSELELLLSQVSLMLSVPQPSNALLALKATSKNLLLAVTMHAAKAKTSAAATGSSKAVTATADTAAAADKAAGVAIAAYDAAVAGAGKTKFKTNSIVTIAAEAKNQAVAKALGTAKAAANAKATAEAHVAAEARAKTVEGQAEKVFAMASTAEASDKAKKTG